MEPDRFVLLPISKVPGYLDAVLKVLALHTEARTSFITLRILLITSPISLDERNTKELTRSFWTVIGFHTC